MITFAGMILVSIIVSNLMTWFDSYDGLGEPETIPESPYEREKFRYDEKGRLQYEDDRWISRTVVDVSSYQKEIDWEQVAADGVEMAMIRLGYRGYSSGLLNLDQCYQANVKGAHKAGLDVGVYFFSQATTLDEVHEEIEFMLEILGDYPLEYPIVLDWEVANPTEGRVQGVTRRELTDMLRYFCDEMSARGFEPMVYFNWTQASRMIYLSELEDYPFWLALYQDRMTYPFRVEMWQYTNQGTVPGINGDVDINLYIPDLTKQ